jgi:AcrR family transcriptional regulator
MAVFPMSTQETDTTRERILEAAGEIFAERGYDATTVRDICQRAGANIAAVNYYFGDKQKLYIAAVVRAHQWRMEQARLPEWAEDTPAETKLADFITTFIRRVRSGPGDTWHTRLIMREMMQPREACVELVQGSIRPQFELLIGVLRELGLDHLSERQLQFTAFSIVGQCLFYHFADPVIQNLLGPDAYGELNVDILAKHITAFSLKSIRQQAAAKAGTRR